MTITVSTLTIIDGINSANPDMTTTIEVTANTVVNTNPVTFAKALADETRQEIMKHLCCVWLNVNELVEKLDGRINQPTVSHHLKILQEADLVFVRQEGRQRFYTLNQEYFTVCCNALMQNFAPGHVANVTLSL